MATFERSFQEQPHRGGERTAAAQAAAQTYLAKYSINEGLLPRPSSPSPPSPCLSLACPNPLSLLSGLTTLAASLTCCRRVLLMGVGEDLAPLVLPLLSILPSGDPTGWKHEPSPIKASDKAHPRLGRRANMQHNSGRLISGGPARRESGTRGCTRPLSSDPSVCLPQPPGRRVNARLAVTTTVLATLQQLFLRTRRRCNHAAGKCKRRMSRRGRDANADGYKKNHATIIQETQPIALAS